MLNNKRKCVIHEINIYIYLVEFLYYNVTAKKDPFHQIAFSRSNAIFKELNIN